MPYFVPISRIPLLYDPPFVTGLVLLGCAIGYRMLKILRTPLETTSALERGVLSAALGLGLLQYVAFGLGMTGILSPKSVTLALIALTTVFLRDIFAVIRGAARAAIRACRRPPDRLLLLGVLLTAVPLIIVLFQALAPPVVSDELGYHLTAPKRWLQSGSLAYLPTLMHTQASLGVEMLYTLAMAVWSDTAAKLIHFALGLLALTGLFALGRRFRGAWVGLTAVFGFIVGIPGRIDIGVCASAYIDMGVALESICAVLAWWLWQQTRQRGWLFASALCAGFVTSFKLTGLFVGLTLAAFTLANERRAGTAMPRALPLCGKFLFASLLPVMPWLARNFLNTHNPVYPLFPGLFPTRHWNVDAGHALTLYFRYYNWGAGGVSGWSLAKREMVLNAAIGLVIAATLVALWIRHSREERFLITLSCVLLTTALATTGFYFRLMMPVLPFLYLLVCLILARPLTCSKWAQAGVLVLMAVFAVHWVRANEWRDAAAAAAGRMARDTYLDKYRPIFRIWQRANAVSRLQPGVRALSAAFHPTSSLTGGASYYCDLPCLTTDGYLQNDLRLDDWNHFLDDIEKNNIRYLVLSDSDVNVRVGPDYLPAQNELPFSRRLARECGERLFSQNSVSLYRLRISAH